MNAEQFEAVPEFAGTGMEWLNYGVLYVSCAKYITLYNALARDLLDADGPIGRPVLLSTCLPVESQEYTLFAEMLLSEHEFRDCVVTWDERGRVRHVLLDSFRQEDDDGNYHGMYVIMKDLGNIVALEQQMQRTDKLATAGKIAAGIAHEIRNPLTTIKGFLQMFERRFRENGMTSELNYAQVMLGEIDRVNTLVSELLLLSKPHQIQKELCTLDGIFQDLNPLIESQALLRDIEYTCSFEQTPPVVVDVAMMKQVILNLAKNAFEAMEHGGKLRISVYVAEPWIRIDVSDTGPGIPYYQFDKIFDAFYTTKDKGTGLGLPICQRIMADHGGEIRVSSKGFGTTFSILLPLVESKESSPTDAVS